MCLAICRWEERFLDAVTETVLQVRLVLFSSLPGYSKIASLASSAVRGGQVSDLPSGMQTEVTRVT